MNRPKLEFVPKTLADLHIEGIHDLTNGRRYGSTQSLSRPRHHVPPSSSVGDLSSVDPFRAWEAPTPPKPRANPHHQPHFNQFKPHPAPRTQTNGRDPWTGDMGFVLLFTFGCGLLLGGVGKLGYFLSLFLWCMVLLFYQNIWAFFWEIFAYCILYLIKIRIRNICW